MNAFGYFFEPYIEDNATDPQFEDIGFAVVACYGFRCYQQRTALGERACSTIGVDLSLSLSFV